MELIVLTLRVRDDGLAQLDAVPSADLRSKASLTLQEPYVRAAAAFVPNKVLPLGTAVDPVTWALATFPDLLYAMGGYLLGQIHHSPDLDNVRSALFS